MTISSKNFTQELMEQLHDWAVDSTDNQLEVAKKINSEDWEIWIYSFKYRSGAYITDENFEIKDYNAYLKQKAIDAEKEQYEALKKKFEKA